MRHTKGKRAILLIMAMLTCVLLWSCAGRPKIVGTWQEIGTTGTLVFFKNGTFTTVDDMGMEVSGNYVFRENGTVQFMINREGMSPEIMEARLNVQGEVLTLTFDEGKEVEQYQSMETRKIISE